MQLLYNLKIYILGGFIMKLEDVDFSKLKKIAIVGGSGSGKTTLANWQARGWNEIQYKSWHLR